MRRVLYSAGFSPALWTLVGWMYVEMFLYFGIAVFACVVVRAFLPVRHGPQVADARALRPDAREIALFAGLTVQGLLVALVFTYRQVAFFPRYGIASVLGRCRVADVVLLPARGPSGGDCDAAGVCAGSGDCRADGCGLVCV